MKTRQIARQIERRIVAADIKLRTNDDGTTGLRGYAAIFDSQAHGEVVKRSAFNRTLSQRDNTRLLVNHTGVPLASIAGGTMTLTVDERGLLIDVPVLDLANPTVQELVSAMSRGDIDQMSFAFVARDCPKINGVRELREVELYDVSVVTFPWYEDTVVELTGDSVLDHQLVSLRSIDAVADLSDEQVVTLLRIARRMAPPGKSSWGDIEADLWEAIEQTLAVAGADTWIYICDIGDDWVVFRVFDYSDYSYGPHLQMSWKRATDGTFKLGAPFEVQPEYNPVATPTVARSIADIEERTHTVAEARALLSPRVAVA